MRYLNLLLTILSFFFCEVIFGQADSARVKEDPFKVEYKIINPSEGINNASLEIDVIGGTPPYQYFWSNSDVCVDDTAAHNLTEGRPVNVTIRDSSGKEKTLELLIPAESLPEIINSKFVPIVEALDEVIFWDPFAAMGFYEPVLMDEEGNVVKQANGQAAKRKTPIIVIWLILGALIFTFYMRFVNIKGFRHAIGLVTGKYDKGEHKGEVSHFQALATALSGTVGLGNIAGVAVAVSLGGPGATLWMIIAGLLGMTSKFVECTLGVKYRTIDDKGIVSGGPMYYLRDGLKKKNLPLLGKVLSILFAILAIGASVGGGNMVQANQSFSQLVVIFPSLENMGPYFGALLAIIVGVVIIGGIQGIAKVTGKMVPFMGILYVLSALVIIIINIKQIDDAFWLIVNGAFSPGALKGGIVGVLIVGFQRSAFSNEAGVGSAAIAHSAVKTDRPVTEGFVSLLEPFIDTVIICTMTALVIIFSGAYVNPQGLEGTELTSEAFSSVLPWYPYILVITIILFAFSTMISWSYYGLKAFDFLFGRFLEKVFGSRKISDNIYRVIFLFFIVIGSSAELGSVLEFSDMMILAMAFPNIIGMYILVPEVRREMKEYMSYIKTLKTKK
ncbi:MAG: amino acid carrier protein [Hyphomicrobiales bacterium]